MTMEHSVKLNCLNILRRNLIGHGVVMEGNRKMSGCLQTFGWHCIYVVHSSFKLKLEILLDKL